MAIVIKGETVEGLAKTMYDFVERTLKDESPSPQALAIVPNVLDKLERYLSWTEGE